MSTSTKKESQSNSHAKRRSFIDTRKRQKLSRCMRGPFHIASPWKYFCVLYNNDKLLCVGVLVCSLHVLNVLQGGLHVLLEHPVAVLLGAEVI